MATYTKIPFSYSVNGKGIQLNTDGTVTSIHQTLSSTTTLDEIWIWVLGQDLTKSRNLVWGFLGRGFWDKPF